MASGEDFMDGSKEVLAVSSIQSEIRSSVLSYLLVPSPRSAGSQPVTPDQKSYTSVQSTVLSPWTGCISHNLVTSPRSCLATPINSSPEQDTTVVSPALRYPHSLSPTRKRLYHSPKSEEACHVFDIKCIPDLEDAVNSTGNTMASCQLQLLSEAKVDLNPLCSANPTFFTASKASSVDRKLTSTGSRFYFSPSRPPRPSKRGRRSLLSADSREASWGGPLSDVHFPSAWRDVLDNPPFRLLSSILLLCFTVLIVFGNHG